jgi:glycosyltransferase involved in cell wall biosynthesis
MFSVVIPLYNKAHIIDRTIISVLTQTLDDFELIIVNDGSTDNSLQVIDKYLSDRRIKIVNQNNQGVSAARNRGVMEAKFEYLAFLDADDEWLPGFFAKLSEAIDMFPNIGMYGCTSWHRNIITGQSDDSTLDRYNGKIQLLNYFDNPHVMPHTSAMVVSKKIFYQVFKNGEGFPLGMKCCEDYACFNRLGFYTSIVYIGFPLAIRNNGVPGQITGLSIEDRFILLKHVVKYYNLTYNCWDNLKILNTSYIIFLKYDLRHRILVALRDCDYNTVNFILTELDSKVIGVFSKFEQNIFKSKKLKFYAVCYIYYTKLIWRTNGFPRVGHS